MYCNLSTFNFVCFAIFFCYIEASDTSESTTYFVPESEFGLAPNLVIQQRSHSQKCGFQNATLKAGHKGYFTSPNYPLDYPSGLQCIWWLKVLLRTLLYILIYIN